MKLKCGWCEKEFEHLDDNKNHEVTIKDGVTTIVHVDRK